MFERNQTNVEIVCKDLKSDAWHLMKSDVLLYSEDNHFLSTARHTCSTWC